MNNNNRGNNNRRRGRGNTRPQGGGQQLNRIDSRARGNAPQMLEKYRKLAHDAHLNGDRVTAEYYLQFADHYFRVIADTRVRQDEQRRPRDERGPDQSEDGDESGEFTVGSDFPSYDQQAFTRPREDRPREDRPREDRPRDERPREDRESRERGDRDRAPRRRDEREPRGDDAAEADTDGNDGGGNDGVSNGAPADQRDGADAGAVFEPAENPFVRSSRGLRPRREDRRPRRDDDAGHEPRAETGAETGTAADHANGDDTPRFDASLLPPSLGVREAAPVAMADDDETPAPAPKRRGRKPKAAVEANDEA
ncbi:MAG: DUF4167 domain-containing protein [Sphingomonadales bacterium]|nr:DUF4167 domain-containing protein [Sphingomonadales bacterium]MBU3991515.1 DUF4167 domain-containing protein [Alphaproteobacteria bacterium]